MADDGTGGRTGTLHGEEAECGEFAAHCASCRCERVFVRPPTGNLRHLILTLLTGGLWLIVWLAVSIERSIRPWRCEICGWHKPEARVPLREALRMGEFALEGQIARKQTPGARIVTGPWTIHRAEIPGRAGG